MNGNGNTPRRGRPPRGGRDVTEITTPAPPSSPRRPHHITGIERYLPDEQREDVMRRRFSPDDFHVAITDDNGHDAKIGGIRFHPAMKNLIDVVVSRGNFPLESQHDLIRWATFEGLKKLALLEELYGGVPNYMARLSAINRTTLQTKHNREFDESYARVKEEAGRLLAGNKEAAAAMFINDVLQDAKQIPQKSWREDYVGRLDRDFGWLLKKEQKAVKVKRGGER